MSTSKRLAIFAMIQLNMIAGCQEKSPGDPFLWLEEIDGKKALEWVKSRNRATEEALCKHPEFPDIQQTCLEILNSKDRIVYPGIRGEFIYNFWQDETHERGLWRRTTPAEYFAASPPWETVLDIDALCKSEGENWAFEGVDALYPDFDRCMLRLSRGGSDAVVRREFDLVKKAFVQDGFILPAAKSSTSWLDRDTLLVGTDFGKDSMTSSGYPRILKRWSRGTPLASAETIFEGEPGDVSVRGFVRHRPEHTCVLIVRSISFFEYEYHGYDDGMVTRLELPADLQVQDFLHGKLLAELKSDWKTGGLTYRQGSLISLDYAALLAGRSEVEVLFEPVNRSSLSSVATTRNQVLVSVLTEGRFNQLSRFSRDDGKWIREPVSAPSDGTLSMVTTDEHSDRYFFTYESMLVPRTLYHVPGSGKEILRVKSLPEYFNAADFVVEHHEAVSKDYTRIPYTVVRPAKARLDGSNPTVLYGYGGFEVALRPFYSGLTGASWLSRGGVFVVANIRGGGEFGPEWHRAALKENRQRSFDDFIAVSEDLIRRGICSSKTLGIMGGSNGGLLVGVAATQRPDLYGAVVCSVPLLDMKRFHLLLAGASWIGEYGNPDVPEEWAYLKAYSPYHNLSRETSYPRMFFKTSTRDDRVHPGHARKMAARMESLGHESFYYENIEGGHGAGVTNEQRAFMEALSYMYLLKMLKP